uniref:Uncharacterized protein n=1 Tax=Siphoviridae sp. ct96x5 TaxID=2825367 RepID=A0A8S5PRL6_9CAUD|nr:MAG TPA: hypothetical protein [Siphoviridae sp. ct96x5]
MTGNSVELIIVMQMSSTELYERATQYGRN